MIFGLKKCSDISYAKPFFDNKCFTDDSLREGSQKIRICKTSNLKLIKSRTRNKKQKVFYGQKT